MILISWLVFVKIVTEISCMYVVHTEDNVLHFIENGRYIESVNLSSLVRRPLEISGETENSRSDKLVVRNKMIADEVKISKTGDIMVGDVKIPMQKILSEPLIYNDTIFKGHKQYIVAKVQGILVFLVDLEIRLVDIKTMYRRLLKFLYVYHIFESGENTDISEYSVTLADNTYSFDRKIVSIYSIKTHCGHKYMSRIFTNEKIMKYKQPVISEIKKKRISGRWVLIVTLAFVIILVNRKNAVKLLNKICETKDFSFYYGKLKEKRVLVKVYSKQSHGFYNEIKVLKMVSFSAILKPVFEEKNIFKNFLVYEETEEFFSNDKKLLKQLVYAIKYLHDEGLPHNSLSPECVRIKNGGVFLMNFEHCGLTDKELGVKGWRSVDLIRHNIVDFEVTKDMCIKGDVFSLGLLLHYYMTGRHPFELSKDEVIKEYERSKTNVESLPLLITDDININEIRTTRYLKKGDFNAWNRSNEYRPKSAAPSVESDWNSNVNSRNFKLSPNEDFHFAKQKNNSLSFLESKFNEDKIKIEPKIFDLEKLENNITGFRYKLFVEDPLKHDLIYHSLKIRYFERTSIDAISKHPYFWMDYECFSFIANLSDILEKKPFLAKKLEMNKHRIFNGYWNEHISPIIEKNLLDFRVYDFSSAKDLLRAIRNKGRHYNELPQEVKSVYGNSFSSGFIKYWLNAFPSLLITCYQCGEKLKEEELLKFYYSNY